MDNLLLAKIHQSIKDDNLKAFDELITQKLLALSLGRFPLLSLCYMYQSYLILSKYEKQLISLKTDNYIVDEEPVLIYPDFKHIAGKALRLFTGNNIVTPAEMLALLGLSDKISYHWAEFEKNPLMIANIKKIYQINYLVSTEVTEYCIKLPAVKGKVHTSDILIKFAVVALCFVLFFTCSLGITVGVFGIGNNHSPIKIYSVNSFVANASSVVSLEKDLHLSGAYIEKFGTIEGNNKKITLDKLELIETLEGELSNLTIELNIDTKATNIETALIKVNNGTIKNVNLIINGTIVEEDNENDLNISALVGTNNGTIENVTIQGDINLFGNATGNASYAGFAGVNNGQIVNCELKDGSIISQNIDLAGFVIINNGTISNVKNYQNILQNGVKLEDKYQWNPNCTGIALNNYGTIEKSENHGNIEATTDTDEGHQIILSGIVANNYGTINKVLNTGSIKGSSLNYAIYAGGLVAFNSASYDEINKMIKYGVLSESSNKGNISIYTTGDKKSELLSGGIVSINEGNVSKCANSGKITANTNSAVVYAGGLAALNTNYVNGDISAASSITESRSDTDIVATIGDEICVFGGLVARNDCVLMSSFSFNKFNITAPFKPVETPDNEEEGEGNNANTLPPYFVGNIAGFAAITLAIGGWQSSTANNHGYSENVEIKTLGAMLYNSSIISQLREDEIGDGLNANYSDKETMIETLKAQGIYWE